MVLSMFLILLLIHLLAAVGFVGWLGASDRMNGQRIQEVVEVFRPTLAEEAEVEAEAEAAQRQAEAARDQLIRLNRVAVGPQTIEDRLAENFESDEFDLHRLERLNAETEAIRRRLAQDKQLIAKQLAELEAKQAAFDELVEQRTAAMADEDFKRAVDTLEQLPARQAKQMVQQYMAQGKIEEVVDYLAAMQLRKSAGVLKEFKAPQEIGQAAQLLEQLRLRGQDPFGQARADGEMEGPAS
jgi:hypothetical protein